MLTKPDVFKLWVLGPPVGNNPIFDGSWNWQGRWNYVQQELNNLYLGGALLPITIFASEAWVADKMNLFLVGVPVLKC